MTTTIEHNTSVAELPTQKELRTTAELHHHEPPTPPTRFASHPVQDLLVRFIRGYCPPDILPTGDALAELKATETEIRRIDGLLSENSGTAVEKKYYRLRGAVAETPTPEAIEALRNFSLEKEKQQGAEICHMLSCSRSAALNDATKSTCCAFWSAVEARAKEQAAFWLEGKQAAASYLGLVHTPDIIDTSLAKLIDVVKSWREATTKGGLNFTPAKVFEGLIQFEL